MHLPKIYSRTNVFIVLVLVYFLFFDTHAQMPVLAPFAGSLGATPFLVGLIVGTYSFFNIIGNIISGHMIDTRSWKSPLTAGMIAIAVSLYAYSLAATPQGLLLIRACHGLAGGLVIPVTMVYLTKVSASAGVHSLTKRMSYYGVSIGLAALTGPPVAGIFSSHYGYANTYVFIALLMFCAAILAVFVIREQEFPLKRKVSLREHFGEIKQSILLRVSFKAVFALMGATGTFASFLPFKAESLGATPAVTGGLFATFAATAIVTQLLCPFLVRRFKTSGHITAGFIILGMALILLTVGSLISILLIAMGLYGLGFGLLLPSLMELVSRGSQPAWKGLATGFFFVFFSLGVALIPPLSGLLQQSVLALTPFLTAAAVVLGVAITITKKQKFVMDGKTKLLH